MVDVFVAWELMHPALTGSIIGIRNEKEAREMKDGTELTLSRDEMRESERATAQWLSWQKLAWQFTTGTPPGTTIPRPIPEKTSFNRWITPIVIIVIVVACVLF